MTSRSSSSITVTEEVQGNSSTTAEDFYFSDIGRTDDFADGGRTYWEGQGLYFEGESSTTYQIHQVDSNDNGDEVGTLVTEFQTNGDGVRVIDTGSSSIETGTEYVITTEGKQVVGLNSTGIFNGSSNYGAASVEAETWEVTGQNLNVEFDDSSVSNQNSPETTVEFSSNRGTYDVVVSANGLDYEELETVFPNSRIIASSSEDDTVTLGSVSSSEDLTANFSEIDADDYNFQFDVVDTSASSGANISVTEAEGSMSVGSAVTEQRGDVATINAQFDNSDTGFVQIGSSDVGYNVTLEVEDGGDGEIGVEMNTFLAGLNESNGSWEYAEAGENLNSTPTVFSLTDDSSDDDDEIVSVTRHSESLASPLEAGSYDIAVSTSAESANGGDWVQTEDDITALELQERNTQGIQIWRAPGNADYDDLDELQTTVNQTSRAAGGNDQDVGDLVVVQLQASGIYGQLDTSDLSTFYSESNGLMFTIEEASPGANQDAATMSLNSNAVQDVYTDEENNSAYLVVDTTQSTSSYEGNFQFESDEEYTGTFEINQNNPMVDEDEDTAGVEKQTAESNFRLVEPDAEFNGLNDNVLQVASSENAQVSGTTNLAPGTEVTVRLRNGGGNGQAFLKSADAIVQSDGSLSTTIDTSDVDVGTNFTATIRRSGTAISDEVDGTMVEQVETQTPSETTSTPSETTATPSETTTSTGETTTAATTTQSGGDGTTSTTTTSNTPGFGMIVALVALVAAALLAVRRDN